MVPEKPFVIEGVDLQLRLVLLSSAPEKSDKLKSCSVTWGEERRLLDLYADSGTPVTDPRVQYAPQDGWCGVKIAQVQYGDRGSLVLEATAMSTGIIYRGETAINVWGECSAVQCLIVTMESL